MGSFRDFKLGQKDYKLGQEFQIGAKRFQIGAEVTNRGKRDFKSGQGLQIGAEHMLYFIEEFIFLFFQVSKLKNMSSAYLYYTARRITSMFSILQKVFVS